MLTSHPYPYTQPTPEEMEEFARRARVERAKAVRSVFLALFRRQPAAATAEIGPSHSAAHAAH
jgi:hypothetical protein